MKKTLYILMILLLAIATGCNKKQSSYKEEGKTPTEEFPSEMVDFFPYENNPVFEGTGTDTWDKNIRERGYILLENGTYHMWYTGYNREQSKTLYLGYATSQDGFNWTRYPGNPIFTESWVEDMCVIKHGDTYYMFAEGLNDIAHMMTSKDRIHWINHGNLDIRYTNGEPLTPGPYGTPTVWIEDEKWFLFYERNDLGIWLAVSTDIKVWTNVQDNPVITIGPENYDKEAVALNQIIKYKGRYYCNFHACGNKPWIDWTTNVAVSNDLIHWKKYPKNPIVSGGDKSSGIFVHDGTQYRLYTMHPNVCVFFPKPSKIVK
jgi:predicted GH43/DUF377 family glycosyl hydrolase